MVKIVSKLAFSVIGNCGILIINNKNMRKNIRLSFSAKNNSFGIRAARYIKITSKPPNKIKNSMKPFHAILLINQISKKTVRLCNLKNTTNIKGWLNSVNIIMQAIVRHINSLFQK